MNADMKHSPLAVARASAIAAAAVLAVTGMAQAAPLKIGLIETLSGPQASTGLLYRGATRYALDQFNAAGGWNGDAVQLVEFDNQGGPAGAADKVKAALAEGVQVIIQGSSSAVSGQITEDVRKYNLRNPGKEVLFLNVGGEAMELTGEKCHFHHFRFSPNVQIRAHALVGAMKATNTLGTRVYSINQNYSAGHDMEAAILANSAAGGYQVVEKVLHEVNKIQDFSPYVAKIAAANADTVMTMNWSNDLLLLMKASKAAGTKVRFATLFLDQPGNIANAGDTAIGHYVAHAFNADANGNDSEAFALDFRAKTGHMPAYIEAGTVFGLQMFASVLKSYKPQDGKFSANAFARQLETARFKTPVGEYVMRAQDHQNMMPIVVSVVSTDAKFKADETQWGFKSVKVFSAQEAATVPAQPTCTMKRPD